jgi:hypothetical protein
MLQISQITDGLLIIDAAGKLSREDIARAEQELEDAHGLADRVLVRMQDFEGWEPAAFWQDLRLDARYRKTFDRVAVVGSRRRDRWLTRLADALTPSEVRYFDEREAAGAIGWLREEEKSSAAKEAEGGQA